MIKLIFIFFVKICSYLNDFREFFLDYIDFYMGLIFIYFNLEFFVSVLFINRSVSENKISKKMLFLVVLFVRLKKRGIIDV